MECVVSGEQAKRRRQLKSEEGISGVCLLTVTEREVVGEAGGKCRVNAKWSIYAQHRCGIRVVLMS